MFICKIILLSNGNLNHDNARLLYCASEWIRGSQLYSGIVDINLPMIFYLYSIPSFISTIFSISIILSFDICVTLLCAISLLLSYTIIKKIPIGEVQWLKYYATVVCTYIFVLLPGYDYGQREHLCILFIMPYLFLAITCLYGQFLSVRIRCLSGLMAGIGFSIKPYFVLVFVAILAFLIVYSRRKDILWRIENLLIYMILVTYAFLLFYCHSAFFTIASVTMQFYFAHNRGFFLHFLESITAGGWGASLVCLFITARHREHLPALLMIFMTGTVFLIVAYIQKKGWTYHYYPANAIVFLFLSVFLFAYARLYELSYDIVSKSRIRFLLSFLILCVISVTTDNLVICIIAALFAIGLIFIFIRGKIRNWHPGPNAIKAIYNYWVVGFMVFWVALMGCTSIQSNVRAYALKHDYDLYVTAIKEKAHGKPVYFMTPSIFPAFPVVLYSGVRCSVRFGDLGLVTGLYYMRNSCPDCKIAYHSPDSMPDVERWFKSIVVQDLIKDPPALIFVDERKQKPGLKAQFDFIEYFSMDEDFVRLIKSYVRTESIGNFGLYENRENHGPLQSENF